MALLVLLAAAARARVVAPDLRGGDDRAAAGGLHGLVRAQVPRWRFDAGRRRKRALGAFVLRQVDRHRRRRGCRAIALGGDARLGRHRHNRLRHWLRRDRKLDVVDGARDLVADVAQQLSPHIVRFALVCDERIRLSVRLQADALAHLVRRRQVLHPQRVDGSQHDEPLQRAHHVTADLLLFVVVRVLGVLDDRLEDRVRRHRRQRGRRELFRKMHNRVQLGDHRIEIPAVGILAGRVDVDDRRQLLAHHVEDDRLEVFALEHFSALGVDHVALRVHHVVVIDDVFADVEVVTLDFRLRRLDRLAHPAALDRHVLFHPEARHHARQPVGREAAHDVVLKRHVEPRCAGVALPP